MRSHGSLAGLFDLSDVRAVVTGAGRGIGAAIARAYAAHGATVALVARSADELATLAASIDGEVGRRATATYAADVTDDASVAGLASWAPDALGGPANVLVNNAGVYIPNRFADYTIVDWQRTFDVNVLGVVRVTQALLPPMLAAGSGRIVNVASTAGRWGTANQSAYNASKHALVGLTRCLALETASSGVRVTALCPGFVDTGLLLESPLAHILGLDADELRTMISARAPIGRMVTPDEVAALAVYLASPSADAMTGVGLTLAGGLILD